MLKNFKTIGLIGRQRKEDITDTLLALIQLLEEQLLNIVFETETAQLLKINSYSHYQRNELGKHCDLIVVVGGDGSLLNAARAAIDFNTPILGINRGRLGFLTDIHPSELSAKVSAVLAGHYQNEHRFLLDIEILQDNKIIEKNIALNDVVLMPGEAVHMIEFSTYIDDQFMLKQHADGLIVATPTGSTAYSLSGGGPILHPKLEAIVVVPMFPHTLSARPIVISSDHTITIEIDSSNESAPNLSCDGQTRISAPINSKIRIKRKAQLLNLIHPVDYNYFDTLRKKLHWS